MSRGFCVMLRFIANESTPKASAHLDAVTSGNTTGFCSWIAWMVADSYRRSIPSV